MLERALEIEATSERVTQAVRNAAHGESTLLACRGSLGIARAVAIAEQQRRLLGLEEAVRISVGHGRIHVQPADTPARRRLPNVPGRIDRRSVFDRRVGERRKTGADDPIALAAIRLHGERRTGADRRSGNDRRRSSAPRGPQPVHP